MVISPVMEPRVVVARRRSEASSSVGDPAVIPERMIDLQMAARKITDNYLLSLTCGSCGGEWKDGVAYRAKTIVQCPHCGRYNLADTDNIRFQTL